MLMGYGYNLQIIKRNVFLPFIFFFIRNLSKVFAENRCYKINSIHYKNGEYYIIYFYPGERLVNIKSSSEIFKDGELMNKFNYKDASLIGFCISNPTLKEFNKIKTTLLSV